MERVKKGVNAHKRHKKVLKMAKGYYGAKSKTFKAAKPATMRALRSAYIGRNNKQREYRSLWIARINAAARMNDISYSRLMNGLKKSNIEINRKMLSEMAIHDPAAFAKICDTAKKALQKQIIYKQIIEVNLQTSIFIVEIKDRVLYRKDCLRCLCKQSF